MSNLEIVRTVTKRHLLIILLALAFFLMLLGVVICPSIDLAVANLFYRADTGFFLATFWGNVAMHNIAYYGARVLAAFLALFSSITYIRKNAIFRIRSKGWFFLLVALIIGPVLIANVGFKDHWGRARPREVIAFGGTAAFSPALSPQPAVHKNGSFVSGDGAFGFFLPSFAYVVPTQRSRRTFWTGLVLGGLFGGTRIMMGAHFLSDVLFAALFMLASSASVFTAMYGGKATAHKWREWLYVQGQKSKIEL